VDAKQGVSTGISARDRAVTIQTAIQPDAKPGDLARPGHIFPLRAHDGGVLKRAGHTEAAVDLCRIAGFRSGAILSELMKLDGTMMRGADLSTFAEEHDLPVITIADLIAYRRQKENFISKEAETVLETKTGEWTMIVYNDQLLDCDHVALVKGKIDPLLPTLVRVHSECLTGDVLGSSHCDCGQQLSTAMEQIQKEGKGVIIYMRCHEGRGIGLINKVKAYELQRKGFDTVEANKQLGLPVDLRDYGIGAQILKDIGIGNMRLMTNNPRKIIGLGGYGLHIVECVPIEITQKSIKQAKYLKAKKLKLGHRLRHV
jgi:3,4-dihydroxy 2-butanone 4-phosphate synthase/GTP cyclohydrolase II